MAIDTLAAKIQSSIGNVEPGSAFAILTSAGMWGLYGVPIVYGSIWGVSTVIVGGIVVLKRWRDKRSGQTSDVQLDGRGSGKSAKVNED